MTTWLAWLERYLGVVIDGEWTLKEGLIAAIVVVLCLLLLAILFNLIRDAVIRSRRKKDAIFSNQKNRYKSRLGKKKIKY